MQILLCGEPHVGIGPQLPPWKQNLKFNKLERFNFCSTWFSLKIDREVVNEQNDQTMAISGNRELELILFGLKNTLIELRLGEWLYDELLIYIAEICKEVEVLEINSSLVTDKSIVEILRKLKYLRFLDLSGCPNFLGTAFSDALEVLASDKIRHITLGPEFNGRSMQVAKSKIHSK